MNQIHPNQAACGFVPQTYQQPLSSGFFGPTPGQGASLGGFSGDGVSLIDPGFNPFDNVGAERLFLPPLLHKGVPVCRVGVGRESEFSALTNAVNTLVGIIGTLVQALMRVTGLDSGQGVATPQPSGARTPVPAPAAPPAQDNAVSALDSTERGVSECEKPDSWFDRGMQFLDRVTNLVQGVADLLDRIPNWGSILHKSGKILWKGVKTGVEKVGNWIGNISNAASTFFSKILS